MSPDATITLPRSCAIGMAGTLDLRQIGREWPAPDAFDLRGPSDRFTSPHGWHVVVFGQSACARAVATVLDRRDGSFGQPLTAEDARQLAWSSLPSAAVIAVHPQQRRVVVLRDGGGFRPLYYVFRDNRLTFSTSLPHLRTLTSERGINTDKIVEMLVYGHRSGGRTVWQGVNVVAAGRLIEFEIDQTPRHQQFWQPQLLMEDAERAVWADGNVDRTLERIGELLEEATAPLRKLDALIVPCGGGVDSSLLGAYLKQHATGQVRFFTVNKVDNQHQEREWMDSLAARLRIPLEYVNVTRENFFRTYFEFLRDAQQPAIGPNLVAHRLLRQQAMAQGETQFVSGELCDTVFGGLSAFTYLSPRFRLLQQLRRLPGSLRFWVPRAMMGEKELFMSIMQSARGEELGRIGGGDLERAEVLAEVGAGRSHVSPSQHMADLCTWLNLRTAPDYLHSAFFEFDEHPGGDSHFPFAHPAMVRLGVHLPYFVKRRKGSNKWIWRKFAERYIGREVAFRRKDTFPAPVHRWFDKAVHLLPDGFLADLLSARVGDLLSGMGPHDPSRWTLVNLELWGRIHCLGQDPAELMNEIA